MKIDRKSLDGLLSMNDRQLMLIINRLLTDGGIDPSEFNINPQDIASIRTALSSASDEELSRVVQQYETNVAAKRTRGGRK